MYACACREREHGRETERERDRQSRRRERLDLRDTGEGLAGPHVSAPRPVCQSFFCQSAPAAPAQAWLSLPGPARPLLAWTQAHAGGRQRRPFLNTTAKTVWIQPLTLTQTTASLCWGSPPGRLGSLRGGMSARECLAGFTVREGATHTYTHTHTHTITHIHTHTHTHTQTHTHTHTQRWFRV